MEGKGYVAGGKWTMRRRDDHATKERRRIGDTRQQEKGDYEG
jgi:hypothetical protein